MKYINILLVTIVACATVFSIQAQRGVEFMTVASPDIPEAVNFCGDHVSFDRIDMAERIDREMTTVIYGQTMTSLIIKRANRYFPRLIEILKENNMPEDLIYLAVAESSLDINALSPAKAAGIWQFMASTGKQYGL
ncbi:MAG: transglycosylase SLT domain-containing protein, partial [Muribaculaceae bacterium]|nr:transglycosylase SLT domain-containing protein [Muribaculaceae bacterium]